MDLVRVPFLYCCCGIWFVHYLADDIVVVDPELYRFCCLVVVFICLHVKCCDFEFDFTFSLDFKFITQILVDHGYHAHRVYFRNDRGVVNVNRCCCWFAYSDSVVLVFVVILPCLFDCDALSFCSYQLLWCVYLDFVCEGGCLPFWSFYPSWSTLCDSLLSFCMIMR